MHPFRRGDHGLVNQYSHILLTAENFRTLSVTPEIATEAERLRATLRIKTPDAIQLATSLIANATAFLSNDNELCQIPGLELILLDRLLARP